MADKFSMLAKTRSNDKENTDSPKVFNLRDDTQSKSEFGWPRNIPKLLRDNIRWILVLGTSMSVAALFFTFTNNDPFEDFFELVLALAVGGSISAAASFRVAGANSSK